MTPKDKLIELAERVYWRRRFQDRKNPGKPGEFLASLPEEDRELLKQLKSEDLESIRLDAVDFMV